MNGKQLKNSILQWAIQGKLVPQDSNDEPASVLLDKIRQEKERLIKEKKIKRDKNDGNPLVYAFKKGEGWTFRSEEDRLAIEKEFNDIATKFAQIYPNGVTIIIPSRNELNCHKAELVMSKSKNAELLEGAICKLTTEEVNDIVLDNFFLKDKYIRIILMLHIINYVYILRRWMKKEMVHFQDISSKMRK